MRGALRGALPKSLGGYGQSANEFLRHSVGVATLATFRVETARAMPPFKKAFDANGIQFAFTTVQVAGGTDAVGAAARQSLDMLKPAPEA